MKPVLKSGREQVQAHHADRDVGRHVHFLRRAERGRLAHAQGRQRGRDQQAGNDDAVVRGAAELGAQRQPRHHHRARQQVALDGVGDEGAPRRARGAQAGQRHRAAGQAEHDPLFGVAAGCAQEALEAAPHRGERQQRHQRRAVVGQPGARLAAAAGQQQRRGHQQQEQAPVGDGVVVLAQHGVAHHPAQRIQAELESQHPQQGAQRGAIAHRQTTVTTGAVEHK
jgi:hypothetical protein